jgi:transposase
MACLRRGQRRLYAAVEANRIGRGGVRLVSQITGLGEDTIRAGRRELAQRLQGELPQAPKPCGGRPLTESKSPTIKAALEELLADEVGGDPMSEQKWVRGSAKRLAKQLKERGFQIGPSTVWRLLKRMGFSMKLNLRRRRGYRPDSPERNAQFTYIASKRKEYMEAGLPVISIDTKKKELIGDFRNGGRAWCREAPEVNEHDFPSSAECRAVPFGIYDLKRNRGYVVIGTSNDTSEFAVTSIAKWWEEQGRLFYKPATRLLILADCGGTNGCRSHGWKLHIQEKLCERLGLEVTVCHYPPGCSKYNPVERRLFSQISINWAGKPLRSLGVMLAYIRGTSTETGLAVGAHLDDDTYRRGRKVTREELGLLNIKSHDLCPCWNYTLSPRVPV